MDRAQRGQLREWAASLVASDDDERRSSGRAILMLLDRVDELERALRDRRAEASARPSPPPPAAQPERLDHAPEPEPEPLALEDTQPIGLRDRLRMATGRLHDH